MAYILRDRIVKFDVLSIDKTEDIFSRILHERINETDRESFFLNYVSSDDLEKYDFTNNESIVQFRDDCISCFDFLKPMGGCNLTEGHKELGIRHYGMKLSDPSGEIPGVFDVNNHVITYSPIFPLFYEERDIVKFARHTYITSLTFQEILINQINNAKEFYVHVDDYATIKERLKYGDYILKKTTREQMLEFVINADKGQKILCKHLGTK